MYDSNDRRGDDDGRANVQETRSGVSPVLIAFIVLAVLAIIFIVQNGEEADITFLFFDVRASVWVAIAIAIGVGILLDRLVIAVWRRRRRRRGDR